MKHLMLVLALTLTACSSADLPSNESREDVAVVQQDLISPECKTLHSPPPFPIVCGSSCCIQPNGTGGCNPGWKCSLSSIGFNIYERNVVGRTCYCIVGGLTYAGKVVQ